MSRTSEPAPTVRVSARRFWPMFAHCAGFVSLIAIAFLSLSAVLHVAGVSLHTKGSEEGYNALLNTLALLCIVFAATAAFARLERRRPLSYGLYDQSLAFRLSLGLVTGFVLFLGLAAIIFSAGSMDFGVIPRITVRSFGWGAFWLATYLCVAVAEEMLFRGYLLFTLAGSIGRWPAILVTSFIFGMVHLSNGMESPVAAINGILFGGVLAWSVLRSGSLWWAIGLHAGWDWAESFLIGASDSGVRAIGRLVTSTPHGNPLLSGGDAGPEGSMTMILVTGIAAVIAVKVARPRDITSNASEV